MEMPKRRPSTTVVEVVRDQPCRRTCSTRWTPMERCPPRTS